MADAQPETGISKLTYLHLPMNFLRGRLQRLTAQLPELLDQLSDDSLDDAWKVLQPLYYDLYMLKAIQESNKTVQPGNTMTREEALRVLHLP